MTKVTLKQGDYVLTNGLTDDQYDQLVHAFMAAGCHKNYGHPRRGIVWWDADGDCDAVDKFPSDNIKELWGAEREVLAEHVIEL